jgi:predicted membrane channel-forming protein YqfA (hemolysin III family)
MLFDESFTFRNFLADAFAIFMFVVWFWLLVIVFSDLFRRRDLSTLAKVIWVIVLIVLPYIGIFAYLLTQGDGMAERAQAQAKHAQENLRQIVGFSAADEIEKLGRLKTAGTISEKEYASMRARLVQ